MDASIPRPSSAPQSLRASRQFLRDAFGHCSRGLFAAAMVLGVARALVVLIALVIQGDEFPYRALIVRPLAGAITALCLLAAVLIAEQGVRVGAARLPTYAAAVIAGAAGAALLCSPIWIIKCSLDGCWNATAPGETLSSYVVGGGLYIFGDALSRGGLAAYIYSYREQLLGSIRALRTAEVERAEAERRLNDTRLHALQAQIDPQCLLDTLARIEALYGLNPAEGDSMLDELIRNLRANSTHAAAQMGIR